MLQLSIIQLAVPRFQVTPGIPIHSMSRQQSITRLQPQTGLVLLAELAKLVAIEPKDRKRFKHTGPDSYNAVTYKEHTQIDVRNDNDIKIDNDNHQTAVSGDAKVYDNTTGGDAVSGDAVNTNSTSVTLNVRN